MQNNQAIFSNTTLEESLKPRHDYGLWTVVFFSILVVMFAAAQVFGWVEREQTTLVGNSLKTIVGIVGIIMTYSVTKTLEGDLKKTWKILTFAYIFNTGGDTIWYYYASVLGEVPFPSLADVSFLVSYPVLFWALISHPTEKKLEDRKKIIIDISLVMVSGSILVWYFIIHPTVSTITSENWIPSALNLSYTVGDMVLILGILATFFRGVDRHLKRSLQIIVSGVICMLIADLGFAYLTLQGTYFGGHWIENFFILNSLSHIYATYYQKRYGSLEPITETVSERNLHKIGSITWLPYMGVLLAVGLLSWESYPFWGEPLGKIILAFTLITVLVVIRQIVGTNENLRLLTEKANYREEFRFRTLVENSSDLITIWDINGNVVFRSPSVKKLLGYEVEEIALLPKGVLVHPEDIDEITSLFLSVCEGKIDSYVKEVRMLHKDGNYRVIESITSRLPKSEHSFGDILVNSRDVTQRKNDEETLRLYTTKIEQSNRELQDFAYVASHDLQEPLRKVQAFGDRLDKKFAQDLGDEGQDYLKRMRDAAGRMQTLINDLLSFSRISTRGTPFVEIDLEKICSEVLVDLEISIEEKQAKVEVSNLPKIDADPLQMRQLFQNLIGNALKFHRKDSPPNVKIYSIVDELTTNSKNNVNNGCKIIVEDNGIGFEEKYLDRIFTVFQRLHGRGEYEGSGVGLAVCRKIVERHHGKITAQSVPYEGTKFIITLPIKNKVGVISNE
jgi:PAS domain S-box-containing protein